jgi:type IV pilus assembly protein PilE
MCGMNVERPVAGFSLPELLVVLAVLAILSAIAWPSYQDSVHKSRRADARVALLQAALLLERCQTLHQRYTHPDCAIPTQSPSGFYRITEPGQRGAHTYRLRATPIGVQGADAKACGFFELDQTGQRASSGSAGSACW